MTGWILAVLGLFVAQTLLGPTIRYYGGTGSWREKLDVALGPRDEPPPASLHTSLHIGRANRALNNMFEALPVFLALALLVEIKDVDDGLSRAGAAVFFLARLAYVPTYLAGIHTLRTALWILGWLGLLMIAARLL